MPDRRLHTRHIIETTAGRWLARCDRGLTPAEQDEFLQWRQADPRHAAAFARQAAALGRLMQLGEWQPMLAAEPNPDIFAPTRPVRARFGRVTGVAAAAAVIVLGLFAGRWLPRPPPPTPPPVASYLRVNERQVLADGSIVELKDGSRIDVRYTPALRRVTLTGGEAHFTVARDPDRPFVVDANGIAVRAVGTAFNVRVDANEVEVLVTEGRVQIAPEDSAAAAMTAGARIVTSPTPAKLVAAGQRMVVPRVTNAPEPAVHAASPDEINATLGWQKPRLQFNDTPLAEAVAEFNRHGAGGPVRRIVLGEPELGALKIGGTFRVDNVDGFVRLLEYTFELRTAERATGEIVLFRSR